MYIAMIDNYHCHDTSQKKKSIGDDCKDKY